MDSKRSTWVSTGLLVVGLLLFLAGGIATLLGNLRLGLIGLLASGTFGSWYVRYTTPGPLIVR